MYGIEIRFDTRNARRWRGVFEGEKGKGGREGERIKLLAGPVVGV